MKPNDASPVLMDPSEESSLVADAQNGDREAFLALTRHYQRPLYRLAFAMTRSEKDAAALSREAFIRAWNNLPEYPSGRRFFPWLLRIARNLSWAPTADRAERDRGDPTLEAFSSLRQDEQLALALLQSGPFRYEEIAALLYIPIGATILRISQARGTMLARAETRVGGTA